MDDIHDTDLTPSQVRDCIRSRLRAVSQIVDDEVPASKTVLLQQIGRMLDLAKLLPDISPSGSRDCRDHRGLTRPER